MRSNIADEELQEVLPRLRRFAFWLSLHNDSADKLVKTCLEQILIRNAGQHQDGNLRVCLFTMMYRQFLDSQPDVSSYVQLQELFRSEAPQSTTPVDQLLAEHSLLNDFSKLPIEERVLLILVTVEKLTYQEAAVTLGVPTDTIATSIARARKSLRELRVGQETKVNS
jgi:RNA polymerase sigma-70 factor (ECF subfamily)